MEEINPSQRQITAAVCHDVKEMACESLKCPLFHWHCMGGSWHTGLVPQSSGCSVGGSSKAERRAGAGFGHSVWLQLQEAPQTPKHTALLCPKLPGELLTQQLRGCRGTSEKHETRRRRRRRQQLRNCLQ